MGNPHVHPNSMTPLRNRRAEAAHRAHDIHSEEYKHGTFDSSAEHMKAKADLMEETRLAEKAKNQRNLAVAAEKIEKKLPRTAESLGHLGAGQPYRG